MPTIDGIKSKFESGEISKQDIVDNVWLATVTLRAEKAKQPRGGFIRPRDLEFTQLAGDEADDLNPNESVSPGTMGMAVDYLTRFMNGTPAAQAFGISNKGAKMVHEEDLFENLLQSISGLDDESIVAVARLTGFDAAFRAGRATYRPVMDINPDTPTIENIRTMVNRALQFFEEFGPVVLDGLKFEGGYTGYVATGDGDFLTKNTL
ncbi:MAG: hypothetical protein ACOYIK_09580 [Coriobacteriales bacterium]|jgi:hypothetical protein